MSRRGIEEAGTRAALRWMGAGAVVLALHLGIGVLLVGRSMLPSPPDAATPGVEFDLEPVAVPQDQAAPAPAPPPGLPDALPLPAVTPPAVQPDPPHLEPLPATISNVATPVETPPTPPDSLTPMPEAAPPPTTQTAPEPAMPIPAVPPSPDNDAVLEPLRPVTKTMQRTKPRPVLAAPPRPKHVIDRQAAAATLRQIVQARAQQDTRREASRQSAADKRSAAAAAYAQQGAAAQERASTSAGEVATWRGELVAHLNRFKRAPAGGGVGTARVSFTVDGSGGVSGARLASSSGDAALDEAAVSMVQRANPVPAPPVGMGSRISLSVPVHFSGL